MCRVGGQVMNIVISEAGMPPLLHNKAYYDANKG